MIIKLIFKQGRCKRPKYGEVTNSLLA